MNFLSPWFLLGALAVAGPVLFHLIRRVARERTLFSSIMFLRPTPPRVTRRRKLEHLWLLLLRCLVLLLLAAAFARPFFAKQTAPPVQKTEARQIVLLVDTSASMRREGVWEKARARAESYLDKASPADQIAVLTFDRRPYTLFNFAEWSSWSVDQRTALARTRLSSASPGWMGTHFGLALTSAAEQFVADAAQDKPTSHRELVLITDLQEGGKLDGLQGHDWPNGMKVTIENIEAKHRSNAGLEILNESGASAGEEKNIHVRVTNARDSVQEKLRLIWSTVDGTSPSTEPMEIYLPPGQSRSFATPKITTAISIAQLQLSDDEESFDNISYYAAPETEHVVISYFGLESANDPEKLRYYLQRVFSGTARRQLQLVRPSTNSTFSAELLNQSSFAVIADKLSAQEASATREWLSNGKSALLVLTDTQMAPTLAALAGLPEIQITEASSDYALLGEINFMHPLFAPFADPRFSDFTHIHFWKHRRWEIPTSVPAQVLARFDDNSPALVQLSVGKGNLLVLTAGWNPADSQLAVSSKFPPLMQVMLDWSGATTPMRFQFETGDSIPSPVSAKNGSVEWQRPGGKKEMLAAGIAFTLTDSPGIYTATAPGKQWNFAVNLPLDESRTAPLSPDEFARLGVPLQTTAEDSVALAQARQQHLEQTELENRQKLWRWIIAGILVITFAEILLSGWLAHRSKPMEVAA
ncbi:MAG: hypothetical protein QOD03_315 [Verrucomicrobiota bacterium]|jgi:hypothetical protein